MRPVETLPRLVLIIDKFSLPITKLFNFIISSAAIDCSWHVIRHTSIALATQQPAEVASGDIGTTVNLRIVLRVRTKSNPQDMIDTGLAIHISAEQSERTILHTGDVVPIEFQTGATSVRSTAATHPTENWSPTRRSVLHK